MPPDPQRSPGLFLLWLFTTSAGLLALCWAALVVFMVSL